MKHNDSTPRLLVVQPSDDYARRVRKVYDDAVFVATRERARLLADHPNVIGTDLTKPALAHRAIERFATKNGVTFGGIVCFVCDYLPATSALAQMLDLPFHSPEAVRRSRRKDLTFVAWSSKHVPTPKTRVVASLPQLRAFTDEVPGPWILKPKQGTGSAWVLKVETQDRLETVHWQMLDGVGSERRGETTYLAQEMVKGVEVSADVFVDGDETRLLRLTEKSMAPSRDTAGIVQAYYPSRRDSAVRTQIASVCRKGAEALGVVRGVVMADVMLTAEGPALIEMALRPGGDCLPDLCVASTGYDPVTSACRVAMGGTPDASNLDAPAPVAALHLMATEGGRIMAIDFQGLAEDARVVSFEPYHEVGDTLRVWKGSYDDRILAACVVRCEDTAALPDLARVLAERIRVLVDTNGPNGNPHFLTEAAAG